jgi:uncharacterized protein (TIGR04141 family)
VFEHSQAQRRFVLINGLWFEVSGDFVREIRGIIAGFPVAQIDLPPVQRRADGRLEPEADYNRRAGGQLRGTAILDGKLARCRTASSGIEPCDLLIENRELVHVKHRKGGSSALSHLFAQARVAAETLVGDEGFKQVEQEGDHRAASVSGIRADRSTSRSLIRFWRGIGVAASAARWREPR